jgi:hypothetical protein
MTHDCLYALRSGNRCYQFNDKYMYRTLYVYYYNIIFEKDIKAIKFAERTYVLTTSPIKHT